METRVLGDESITPNDEIIFSIIGEKKKIWNQTFSYLYDNHEDISVIWKFYKDGKNLLLRILKKKKTIFWIRILDDTFRIAFWFAERLEAILLKSDLPESIKLEYKNAKSFNKSRCIYIDIQGSDDLQNVKKLIDLKIKN